MKQVLVFFLLCLFANAYAQENEKKFSAAELLADYDTLHAWIKAIHPKLYANADSVTTEKRWKESRHHFDKPMSSWEFHKAIAPLVHQYNDGHTFVEVDFSEASFKRFKENGGRLFPLPVRLFGDSVVVLTDSTNVVEPGSLIASINGKPIKQIVADVSVLLSGDSKENLNANLSRLFSYLYWLAYKTNGPYTIDFKTPAGAKRVITSAGILVEDYFKRIFPSPLWTLTIHKEESLAVIECTGYNGNLDRIRQKLDSFFTIIRQQSIQNVALDLRRNGGGNSYIGNVFLSYVTTKPFSAVRSKSYRNSWAVQNFPEKDFRKKDLETFKLNAKEENGFLNASYDNDIADAVAKKELLFNGSFYLLTSHRTYSSAHMTALQVKCAKLGTIVGQPTGEMVDLTGEIKDFQLPNTKLPVWIPLAMYTAACPMEQKVGVQPDHSIQPNFEDVINNRDTEVEFIKTLIRRNR